MARKDKKFSARFLLKPLGALLLGVALAVFTYLKTDEWLRTSPYFLIREIYCDPSLEFLKSSPLLSLKGKNLYSLDLRMVQKKLQAQYPEISHLRLLKRYPDRLLVVVQQRIAHAQVALHNAQVVVDEYGSILAINGPALQLPLISGSQFSELQPTMGATLKGDEFKIALRIVQEFANQADLNFYRLTHIHIDNPSEIFIYVFDPRKTDSDHETDSKPKPKPIAQKEGLKIILDSENIREKMNLLAMVLAQAKNDLDDVKYVDLRFKEAILGKK